LATGGVLGHNDETGLRTADGYTHAVIKREFIKAASRWMAVIG